jgi:hypothetical protein
MAVGLVPFAAIMMFLVGVFQAFTGLVAILNDEFYVATEEYLLKFDQTTWGWVHLILGLVIAAAGVGLNDRPNLGPGRGDRPGADQRHRHVRVHLLLPAVDADHHRP